MANLEGTPEFQRQHDLVCPDVGGRDASPYSDNVYVPPQEVARLVKKETVERTTRHIIQSIIAESPYPTQDMEWDMWHAVRRLEDENGLPDGVTAEDLYQHYLRVFEGE